MSIVCSGRRAERADHVFSVSVLLLFGMRFLLYKNPGETPLTALKRLRYLAQISSDIPLTYAGRLDPLAEGLLIVLGGEECKKKEQFLAVDKVYECTVLLGFATDTGDVLGLLTA